MLWYCLLRTVGLQSVHRNAHCFSLSLWYTLFRSDAYLHISSIEHEANVKWVFRPVHRDKWMTFPVINAESMIKLVASLHQRTVWYFGLTYEPRELPRQCWVSKHGKPFSSGHRIFWKQKAKILILPVSYSVWHLWTLSARPVSKRQCTGSPWRILFAFLNGKD